MQRMAYKSQFDFDSEKLEELKEEVITKHHCPSGLKIILYYKIVKHDEKRAKIWTDNMKKCSDEVKVKQ